MTTELFCLHGFLGAASDWDRAFLSDGDPHDPIVLAPDWLALSGAAADTWDELAALINRCVLDEYIRPDDMTIDRRILVGYSLGGRVAMRALIANPEQWSGAVIIAADPGLQSNAERGRRLDHDWRWAKRFGNDPWPALIRDWNAQPVFGGEDPPFDRAETAAARVRAVVALERWSLGTQRDLRPALRRLTVPVLWVSGERDIKYVLLMRECATLNPRFRYAEVPGAGHRAPWTAAPYFEKVVRDWIDTVPTIASHEHEDPQPT